MSARNSTPKSRAGEPRAVELIEEAVQLLRRAPASALAIYFSGAVPFVLGLLFFWAHTTWFHPPSEIVAWGALGLAALYLVMQASQAEFCARLMALRLGDQPPSWSWRKFGQLVLLQLRLQPWIALAGIPVTIISVPLGWWYAYAQNVTVLGNEERLHDEALTQAKLWPKQNHTALLLLAVLAGCTWLNFAGAFFLIPWMANRFLGIENMFGFSGWRFLNSTFLASVTVLTWLAVDPLVKAFYTLRIFHGRARATGEDVRVELRLAQQQRSGRMRAAAVILLATVLFVPDRSARAAEPAPVSAPQAVAPGQLDRALDDVLSTGDFRWRLPPPAKAETAQRGVVGRFIQQGYETVREMFRSVGRWLDRVRDWIDRHFKKSDDKEVKEPTRSSGSGAGLEVVRFLLYVFIGVAVLLILWVVWLIIARARRSVTPLLTARAVAAASPDLRDDNVQAAQLPADGWLALAQEQMAKGEWRLAWRALYLATLARLAAEGLVSLAKFKTNLDYEREVRRRALSRTEIVTRFAFRRRAFEDVWYGREQAAEAAVREWLAELERPTSP